MYVPGCPPRPEQLIAAIIEMQIQRDQGSRAARCPDGVIHLFQPAKTGSPDEYGKIKASIAPEVLDDLADWTARVTKLDEPKKQP